VSESGEIDSLTANQLADLLLMLEVELNCEEMKGNAPSNVADLVGAIEDIKHRLRGCDRRVASIE